MPYPAPAHRSFADRNSLYREITDKIIAELEQGRVPWAQPWRTIGVPLALPRNAATGRHYRGINILILWSAVAERGFTTQTWLTFRQALKIGAHVRKGEKGTTVVYADRFVPYRERTRAAETGDEPDAIPFLKRFTVFNADQCENLSDDLAPSAQPAAADLILPQAEALIRATGADLRIGGNRAFYVPSEDFIQVPPPSSYFEPVNWHRTVCHELGHWSGHSSRLNRDLSGSFGSPSYAREELCAEMTGAFVCAALSIVPTVRHSDYLASWLEVLREDNRAIIRAASAASKAADYLLAFRPGDLDAPDPAGVAPPLQALEPFLATPTAMMTPLSNCTHSCSPPSACATSIGDDGLTSPAELNALARIHLGITDLMERIKAEHSQVLRSGPPLD